MSENTNHSGPAGDPLKKVIIVFDDIDRHEAGCACDLCDCANKSYGFGIFDAASRPEDAGAENAWWMNSDPLIRVYAASEQAGLEAATLHCTDNGWVIASGEGVDEQHPEEEALQEHCVEVREVWIQPKKIRARSKEEALRLVEKGGGEVVEAGFEYSHDLPADNWTVTVVT